MRMDFKRDSPLAAKRLYKKKAGNDNGDKSSMGDTMAPIIGIGQWVFRPLLHSRMHLWASGLGGSDRYLHYPIGTATRNDDVKRQRNEGWSSIRPVSSAENEFLRWTVNVGSDHEEDLDEVGREEAETRQKHDDAENDEDFKEWVVVKAQEAEIQLSNDFVSAASGRDRTSTMDEPWDAFSLAYRTFELTSFDQLLRDSPSAPPTTALTAKRFSSLSGLNQSLFQTTSFMRIFTSPESSRKARERQEAERQAEISEEDDDDDGDDDGDDGCMEMVEDDGMPIRLEHDLQVEEDCNGRQFLHDLTSHWQRSLNPSKSASWSSPGGQLNLSTGLKSSEEAYFGEAKDIWERWPNEVDMEKYRRYVEMAELSAAPCQEVERKMRSKDSSGVRSALCKLGPMFEFQPSFFMVDSAFHVRLDSRISNPPLPPIFEFKFRLNSIASRMLRC